MSDIQTMTNAPFELEFNGQKYTVKKASIEQVARYIKKSEELSKNGEPQIKSVGYALWLILSKTQPSITEQEVLDNVPGNIDLLDTLIQLGFINPKQAEETKRLQEALLSRLSSKSSLPSSQNEPAGLQNKSDSSPSAN